MPGPELPPWLRTGPIWGPLEPVAASRCAEQDWATAAALCAALDGTGHPSSATLTEFGVRSPDSLWLAFDLLAQPRTPRPGCEGPAHTMPAPDAALTVGDAYGQSWRICWQHNGIEFRTLTAVLSDGQARPLPVSDLPDVWWPMTIRSGHREASAPAPVTAAAAIFNAETPVDPDVPSRWTCPSWCELPSEHRWTPASGQTTRTHRGTHRFTLGDRHIVLAISVSEHATEDGIRWGTPHVRLADVTVPGLDESAFVHALLPQIGAALRIAALPLPPRMRIVGQHRVVDIPASLATRAGLADARAGEKKLPRPATTPPRSGEVA